ncbi:hypothetical protein BD770DRAFT_388063 [Pilaira anomala]|nr:hypothetical protein BD770DRAFT_388063 [Pilaira anomala]
MVSFNLFKAISFLAFISSFVSAAPANNGCDGFRVTSPTSYFTTTAGQCQEVSYDLGPNPPSTPAPISVDIYEYGTNKLINKLVNRAPTTNGVSTPWFNVDLGSTKKTGNYYFLVTYNNCKPIKTSYFNVIYNKNSGPATCP